MESNRWAGPHLEDGIAKAVGEGQMDGTVSAKLWDHRISCLPRQQLFSHSVVPWTNETALSALNRVVRMRLVKWTGARAVASSSPRDGSQRKSP